LAHFAFIDVQGHGFAPDFRGNVIAE
jgi:hypothetical protein